MVIRSPAVSSMSSSRGVGNRRDAVGHGQEVIGRIAHGGDHDDDLIALLLRGGHPLGDGADARGVPTDVPPYFWTITGTLTRPPFAVLVSVAAGSGRFGQAGIREPERLAEETDLHQEQVLGHLRLAWRVGDAGERITEWSWPASSNAFDSRSVFATYTLSSASPWISSSGRVRLAASSSSGSPRTPRLRVGHARYRSV